MEWLRNLFGGGMPKTTYYGDAPRGEWPSQQALGMARQYDQAYGSTAAGFVEPNATAKMRQYRTADEYINTARSSIEAPYARGQEVDVVVVPGSPGVRAAKGRRAAPPTPERVVATPDPLNKYGLLQPMLPGQADRMNEAYVGSQRSALSAIGFDPRRLAAKVPDQTGSNIEGRYRTLDDMKMVDGRDPSTPVHEALHRGIDMLRRSGRMPEIARELVSTPKQEEYAVRAFMLRNFGDIEREGNPSQVGMGQRMMEDRMGNEVLEAIERAAAEQYARDTPTGAYRRGPR
jgi:hypothetical protein